MAQLRKVRHSSVPSRSSEVTSVFEAEPKSGIRRGLRVARRVRVLPLLGPRGERASVTSETDVNSIVTELARLSVDGSVPSLRRPLTRDEKLTPPEAYIVSLMDGGMSVRAILDVSPMLEDETLRFLANLVTNGLVTLR